MRFLIITTFLGLAPSTLSATLPRALPVTTTNDMAVETITTRGGEIRTVYFSTRAFSESSDRLKAVLRRFNFFASGQDRNLCGTSTFTDKTSGGSPNVGDCICLRDFLGSKTGVYSVNRDEARFARLATCGTCTFGVDTANFFGTDVGNTDARDVINDAINRFQRDGRISAEGRRMGCDNAFQTAGTDRIGPYFTVENVVGGISMSQILKSKCP
jgi:hypothetical protein